MTKKKVVSKGRSDQDTQKKVNKMIEESLEVFDFNNDTQNPNVSLHDQNLQLIVISLQNYDNITELNLYGNEITSNGMISLCNWLKNNDTLEELDISQNPIKDEGMKVLTDALTTNSCLRFLDAQFISLTCIGAQHIANMLLKNTTLEGLDLNNNSIGNQGFRVISMSLKTNESLTSLDLDNNVADEKAHSELAKSIAGSAVIESIYEDCENKNYKAVHKAILDNASNQSNLGPDDLPNVDSIVLGETSDPH